MCEAGKRKKRLPHSVDIGIQVDAKTEPPGLRPAAAVPSISSIHPYTDGDSTKYIRIEQKPYNVSPMEGPPKKINLIGLKVKAIIVG